MNMTRVFLLVLAGSACCIKAASAQEYPAAVSYQGRVYYSVDKLAEDLGGAVSLSKLAREIKITAKDKEWVFLNGGQGLKLPSGKEIAVRRPLLVLAGRPFIPLEECADAFGCRLAPKKAQAINPPLVFMIGAKQVTVQAQLIGSTHHRHQVDKLEAVHQFVKVVKPLRGLRTLHRKEDGREMAADTTILIRRKLDFDGVPHIVASDCGTSLDSFLIPAKEVETNTKPAGGAATMWSRYRSWFIEQGKQQAALRRGDPHRLEKTVALTIDLCWSLRPYEHKLFQTLQEVAKESKTKIHPVMFVSGRWLEQHPLEMHELIQLSLAPNIEVIWGHHSWEHPKSGGFMNDFPPPALREDTLRLERLLLEWGITPTVYYRFPGLIHDHVRLREILELDLFPIDCDSWLALVGAKDRGPFYYQVRAGSIILVHGNGNEPRGIPLIQTWLATHRDWELGHLNRFLMPKE